MQLLRFVLTLAALRTVGGKPELEDHQKWLNCVASPASCTTLFLINACSGGTIPNSIGRLTALTSLYLASNGLTGTIPEHAISLLTALNHLQLQNNDLEGTIPANAIGELTKLEYLSLSGNDISGTIPGDAFRRLTADRKSVV
jgi:hypothetical protein